jgi:hypothetical protein
VTVTAPNEIVPLLIDLVSFQPPTLVAGDITPWRNPEGKREVLARALYMPVDFSERDFDHLEEQAAICILKVLLLTLFLPLEGLRL